MGDVIRKAFQPEIFVKVGKMENGEPLPKLLEQIYQKLDSSYATLVDKENGIIYLKKKKKGEK